MATSTIPAVRAFLTGPDGLFTTASGLAAVQVSYGVPTNSEQDNVVLAGTADWDQEWAALGNLPRDERYTLELFIEAAAKGRSQQEAVEKAFDMLAVIEDLMRPTDENGRAVLPHVTGLLAGAQVLNFEMRFRSQTDTSLAEGRGAQIHAGVRVATRI